MTDKTFPARGDHTPEAVRARIAELSEWFGIEPVKLKVRKGSIYFTDDLFVWCDDNGVSLDWIYAGEPRGMAAAYREKYARTPEQREFINLMRQFSEGEQEMLADCLRAHQEGRMTLEDALADFKRRVDARRAKTAA